MLAHHDMPAMPAADATCGTILALGQCTKFTRGAVLLRTPKIIAELFYSASTEDVYESLITTGGDTQRIQVCDV